MRKENATFKTKFISESGSYLINSDYFAFVELKDYACYCIADGIDSDQRAESAKLAVTELITAFTENPGMSKRKCKKYMEIAHRVLLKESKEIRLEASLVVVLTDYKKFRYAHAGNSRLITIRNGNIKNRTKDTSLSQRMADNEEIPIDQVADHEERHNLYCYLGQPGRFTPVISKKRKFEDGDIVCLFTRGIWESVGDAEILDSIEGASEPEVVCTNMEDIVLSHQRDLLENYTIATIFVDKVYKNPKAGKIKKIVKIVASVAIALLTICMTIFLVKYRTNSRNAEQMMTLKERGITYLNELNYTQADTQFDEAVTLADKIKVRKNSKMYTNKQLVFEYDTISGYLTEAEQAIAEGEYKKAANKYIAALAKAEVLKTEYEEDIAYIEAIKTYQTYAENMRDGIEALNAYNYDTAAEAFENASKAADSVDDTIKRNAADDNLRAVNGERAMIDAAAFESAGQALLDQKLYIQAKTEYGTALNLYQLAKEKYNVEAADSKISVVNIILNNIEENIEKQNIQELEAEADDYIQKGNEAQHSGNYEEAAEYYANAKEIYAQTGNVSQEMNAGSKQEGAQYGPDQQQALQNVLDGMSYIACGDYESAISELTEAKEAYTNLGDTASASAVANTISSLQQINNAAYSGNAAGNTTVTPN